MLTNANQLNQVMIACCVCNVCFFALRSHVVPDFS